MHHSRLALLLLLLTWIAPLVVLAQEEQPNFYAVVIGISEFENLPKEEWLEFADDDARDFYKLITNPRVRAFPPENVFLLTDQKASFYAIRKKLGSTLPKKVKRGDTVYIFNEIRLEPPTQNMIVATAIERLGDVLVSVQVLRSRDASLSVSWAEGNDSVPEHLIGIFTQGAPDFA